MSTSTFDRPLVLTEKGVDRLIELIREWDKNPPKDNIKPYTAADRMSSEALLEKYWYNNDKNKND